MRAFFLSLLLLFSTFPAEAQHNIFLGVDPHTAATSASCPFLIDNGCAGSIPGQPGSTAVLLPNARLSPATNTINLVTGLSTDYSVNGPPQNMAGIDFYVGDPLPTSSLKDPSVMANWPAGCTYSATGGINNNPLMLCNILGSANMTFDSFDMTIGGTTCVALETQGNTTGTLTITNNYWKNNGICVPDIAKPQMISMNAAANAHFVVEYNTLDANPFVYPYTFGGCARASGLTQALPCNPIQAIGSNADATIEYNSFYGFTARPIQYTGTNPSVGLVFKYNLIEGCCSDDPGAHNEWEQMVASGATPGLSQFTLDSNTWIAMTNHDDSGDAAFPSQFVTAVAMPIFNIRNNFVATGLAGGASLGATFSGSITGNTFTASTVTGGNMGSGQIFACGTAPLTLGVMTTYPGSTGSTSAGPGGGGFGSTGSTWPVQFGSGTGASAFVTGGINNGTASAGNTFTVTADPTLTLQIGTSVSTGGTLRKIDAIAPTTNPDTGLPLTGAGTTGTYHLNGAAELLAVATITVLPPDIFAGGWTVPATIACATAHVGVTAFSRAMADVTTPGGQTPGPVGQADFEGNYADLQGYGPTGASIFANRSAFETFNGTIAGTSLTYNSGTVPIVGQALITTGGVASNTTITGGTSPNFTVSVSQTIGPISMTAVQTFCTNPTIWGSAVGNPNVDMSGIYNSTQMNEFNTETVPGNGC